MVSFLLRKTIILNVSVIRHNKLKIIKTGKNSQQALIAPNSPTLCNVHCIYSVTSNTRGPAAGDVPSLTLCGGNDLISWLDSRSEI